MDKSYSDLVNEGVTRAARRQRRMLLWRIKWAVFSARISRFNDAAMQWNPLYFIPAEIIAAVKKIEAEQNKESGNE